MEGVDFQTNNYLSVIKPLQTIEANCNIPRNLILLPMAMLNSKHTESVSHLCGFDSKNLRNKRLIHVQLQSI